MTTKQKILTRQYNAIMKKLLVQQLEKTLQYNDYLKKSEKIKLKYNMLIKVV
jgi:hypothetical protein